jgi:hypothetical protein
MSINNTYLSTKKINPAIAGFITLGEVYENGILISMILKLIF